MKKLILLLSIIFIAFQSQAARYYVDSAATGANNGSSWADAYNTVQDALSNSLNNDEIWVASGTYYISGNRDNSFNIIAHSVYGGFSGTENSINQRNINMNPTILSGDISKNDNNNINHAEATRSDNAYAVVQIDPNIDGATFDGFIIEGGNSNHATNFIKQYGGAIKVRKGSLVGSNDINVEINNCQFRKNTAIQHAVGFHYTESGSNSVDLNVLYDKCSFKNNAADAGLFYGASAYGALKTILKNCLVADNNNLAQSGVLFYLSRDNTYQYSTELYLLNCTVANNTSSQANATRGVVSYFDDHNNWDAIKIYLANNIFANNATDTVITEIAGSMQPADRVYLGNNIFQDSLFNYNSPITLLDGGMQFIDNGANVAFTNSANGDYHLSPCSDGINAGKTQSPMPGTDFYFDYAVGVGNDLDDSVRVQNGTIDLGCYESSSSGGSISVTISFNGTDLSVPTGYANYEWKRNGTTISGATSATYSPTQNGNYEVIVTDAASCTGTATYNLNNLNVQDFATAKIGLYPNPVIDILNIGLDNQTLEIIVRDLTGKTVLKSNTNRISVQSLTKGIYLIEAQQNGKRFVSKFVKE